jgi:hypothetical protein
MIFNRVAGNTTVIRIEKRLADIAPIVDPQEVSAAVSVS